MVERSLIASQGPRALHYLACSDSMTSDELDRVLAFIDMGVLPPSAASSYEEPLSFCC